MYVSRYTCTRLGPRLSPTRTHLAGISEGENSLASSIFLLFYNGL